MHCLGFVQYFSDISLCKTGANSPGPNYTQFKEKQTPMGTLTVKAASKLAGINPHTLRAWERRYRAIAPERSGTGRRLYSLEEVVRIRMLSSVVRGGHPIREIANLSNDELKKLQEDIYLNKSGSREDPYKEITPLEKMRSG